MSNKEKQSEKEAVARLNRAKITPKKSRKIVDMIRGLDINEAKAQLSISPKKASDKVLKVLRSAIANAEHNHEMSPSRLKISEIKVDEGPTLKRWLPRARGSADEIHKKTSHITVKLKEKEEVGEEEYVIPKTQTSGGGSSDSSDSSEGPVERKEISPDKSRQQGGMTDQIFNRKSGME